MFQFLKSVKAELFKVIWPSKKDVFNYTLTVVLFSLAVAAFLGAADIGLLKLFETIISK